MTLCRRGGASHGLSTADGWSRLVLVGGDRQAKGKGAIEGVGVGVGSG